MVDNPTSAPAKSQQAQNTPGAPAVVLTKHDAELLFDAFIDNFAADKAFSEYRPASLQNKPEGEILETRLKVYLFSVVSEFLNGFIHDQEMADEQKINAIGPGITKLKSIKVTRLLLSIRNKCVQYMTSDRKVYVTGEFVELKTFEALVDAVVRRKFRGEGPPLFSSAPPPQKNPASATTGADDTAANGGSADDSTTGTDASPADGATSTTGTDDAATNGGSADDSTADSDTPRSAPIPDTDVPGLDTVSPDDPEAAQHVGDWFERRNRREASGGFLASLFEWIRRGHQVYAFTWWMFPEESFSRLKNQHIYPRQRGDFRAQFTENPNKDIFRYISEDLAFEEAHAKADGEVQGKYLGYMGLSHKVPRHPVLENRHDGGNPGRLVEPFSVPEGWVVALGVAHVQRFDLLRMKFNGISSWHFDWAQLTWKWVKWDGPGTSANKGKVEVRVVRWDDEVDELGNVTAPGVCEWFDQHYRIDDYDTVVKNPENLRLGEHIHELFDMQGVGINSASVERLLAGETQGDKKTNRNGFVDFEESRGNAIEFVAKSSNYTGITINGGFAPKAPILTVSEQQSAETNPDTALHRRVVIADPVTKRVLIILQKKERIIAEPEVRIIPFTEEKTHNDALKSYFGTKNERTFTGEFTKNEFAFYAIKKSGTGPVEQAEGYLYYLFLAKKEGDTYTPLTIENSESSSVTLRYKDSLKTVAQPALNTPFNRGTGAKHYWYRGGGNETIIPNWSSRTLPDGIYRLYILVIRHNELPPQWVPDKKMDEIFKITPGDCSRYNHFLWDFNYIDFKKGAVSDETTGGEPTQAETKKAFKEMPRLIEKMKDKELKNPHNLQWINKDDYMMFVELYEYIRVLLKKHSIMRKHLDKNNRERFFKMMTIIYFIVVTYQKKAIKNNTPDQVRKEMGGIIGKELGSR
jgi:hypothetical protein